jgi:hypothetical protein
MPDDGIKFAVLISRRDGGGLLCLGSAHAWILPMPGFRLCLDFAYAWISPMPGFRLCLDSAYAWILPMPGFRLCLDFAYAWIKLYMYQYHMLFFL